MEGKPYHTRLFEHVTRLCTYFYYCDAADKLIPNLNRNALIIADNSLWYGRVAEKVRDKKTLEIKKFNRYLIEHPDFVTTILPLRDGVLVAYKLQ